MTSSEWIDDAVRAAERAILSISIAREHLFQARRALDCGKVTGQSIRLAGALGDLQQARSTVESIKAALGREVGAP